MNVNVTPYQHFKGGHYLVYGDIQPLPTGYYKEKFSFVAKESENATEVEVIVTPNGIFYLPFSDVAMTLYLSEQTGEWWLRPSAEFHGEKRQEDGSTVKRFALRDTEEQHSVILQPSE